MTLHGDAASGTDGRKPDHQAAACHSVTLALIGASLIRHANLEIYQLLPTAHASFLVYAFWVNTQVLGNYVGSVVADYVEPVWKELVNPDQQLGRRWAVNGDCHSPLRQDSSKAPVSCILVAKLRSCSIHKVV